MVKKVTLFTISLVLSLLLLELFLRWFQPFEFRVKGENIILPIHRQYVIPNKEIPTLDPVITHSRNSLGFRGEEPPKDMKSTLSIIVVGGSAVESFFISDGKTWIDVLGTKLKEDFKTLWINNAGLNGHTTFGHILLLKDHIVKIQPKVVLFLVGLNDVGVREMTFNDRLQMKTLLFKHPRYFLVSLANYSETAALLLNIVRTWKARTLKYAFPKEGEDIFIPKRVTTEEFIKLKREHKPILPKYRERLSTLIQICQNHRIAPIFMTQPVRIESPLTPRDRLNLETGFYTSDEMNWITVELYNDVLREICLEERVSFIDLSLGMEKKKKYFMDGYHFNNLGSQVVGEWIYYRIKPMLQLLESE